MKFPSFLIAVLISQAAVIGCKTSAVPNTPPETERVSSQRSASVEVGKPDAVRDRTAKNQSPSKVAVVARAEPGPLPAASRGAGGQGSEGQTPAYKWETLSYKRYAVLVGVNEYQHESLPPLRYAVADVEDLAGVLKASGFEVALLAGPKALKQTVEAAIDKTLARCQKGDLVLIALAGHGLQFQGQADSYFCPVDARPFADTTASLVSLQALYDRMERSFAGAKVLLVDACRDDPQTGGGVSRGSSSRGSGGVDADTAPRPPRGVAALYSCSAGQKAWEHQSLGHGVFFHFVLEGLRGKATDRSGEIDFGTLASFVSKNTARTVPTLIGDGAQQSPNLKADLVGAAPVLARIQRVTATAASPASAPVVPTAQSAPAAGPTVPPAVPPALTAATLTLRLSGGVALELVRIRAGRFVMGSPPSEFGRNRNDELPHPVTLTKDFYIGVHEVTQEQYHAVMGGRPSHFRGNRCPVEQVSWHEATAFCEKLSQQTGRSVRLPTEAQWEYACRAGTITATAFGESLSSTQANFDGNDPYQSAPKGPYARATRDVGSYQPNPWGLYDAHGNVWEWCSDRYGPYSQSPATDPQGPSSGQDRVARGGSWHGPGELCRSAQRSKKSPTLRDFNVGFRIVLDP